MQDIILKQLLNEYEKKRLKAISDLENKKSELFLKCPKLKKIEDELNFSAILAAKNILVNSDPNAKEELSKKITLLKKEKAEILESLNLPDNFLLPKYECSLCNDTGYVQNSFGKTNKCTCLEQKLFNIHYNKSNITNLERKF